MASTRQRPNIGMAKSAIARLAADSAYEFSLIVSGHGSISFANERLLKSSRHRIEGVRGRPLPTLLRRTDGKPLAASFLRPQSKSNPQRKNFSVLTSDGRRIECRGKVYYFDSHGREPAGALVLGNRAPAGVSRDRDILTDRIHASGLLSSVGDGLCVVDARGTILSVNAALAAMARLHAGEMAGVAPPYPWLGIEENARLAAALAGVVRTGAPAHLLIVQERDQDRPIALSFSIWTLHLAGGLYLASVRDISDIHPVHENQMAEKRIERLKTQVLRNAERLKTLQEVNSSVLRSGSVQTIYRRITEGVGRLVDHDLAGVYVLEEGGNVLRPHTVSRLTPFSRQLGKLPLTAGRGIVGSAASSGVTVTANDAQKDPRSVYPPGMKPEVEHIIAAPIRGRHSTYGILTVARNRHPGFQEEDSQIVQSFADAASIAIESIHLYGSRGAATRDPGKPRR